MRERPSKLKLKSTLWLGNGSKTSLDLMLFGELSHRIFGGASPCRIGRSGNRMADPESWFSLLSLDDSLPHRSPQQEPQAWSGGVSSVVAPHPSAGNGGLFGYQAVASLGEGAAAFFTDGLRVDFSQFRTASDPVDIVAPHPRFAPSMLLPSRT